MVIMHVWFIGLRGAPRRNCRQTHGKTSFSPFRVFLFSRNSRKRFWGLVVLAFMDWEGSASWAFYLNLLHLGIEVLNVGGWLTHGDLAYGYWC